MQVALTAGGALPAAFLGEEFLVHAEKVQNGGALINDQNRSGAYRDTCGTQFIVGIGGIENGGICELEPQERLW